MHVYVRIPGAGSVVGMHVDRHMTGHEAFVSCMEQHDIPERAWTHFRLVRGGTMLCSASTLEQAGVRQGSFLELRLALRGGGGDGGSTGAEDRRAWLEMYQDKRRETINPEEARLAQWTTCRISGMPLNPPCVVDELGSLYNKDAVLHALLTKTMPRDLAHISSLKHVFDITLTPANKASDAAVKYVCPVTGVPMNGRARFLVIRSSGQSAASVVSERAVKELPEVVKEIVGSDWASKDVIPLYPTEKELEQMSADVLAQREAERAAKAARKAAKSNHKKASHKHGQNANANESSVPSVGSHQPVDSKFTLKKAELKEKPDSIAAKVSAPPNADPVIWQSIFSKRKPEHSNEDGNAKKTKSGGNDFLLRGGLKYVA